MAVLKEGAMADAASRYLAQTLRQLELTVASGALVALRLFHVAHAIDLPRAEALLAKQAREARLSRLIATPADAMAFREPPIALELEPVTLAPDGKEVAAAVTARLYHFGAVAISLRVPVQNLLWSGFVRQVNAFDRAVQSGQQIWDGLLHQVRGSLGPAFERPSTGQAHQGYLIGVVQAFDRALTGSALFDGVDLAPVLSGEQRPLSDAARQELLRRRFSYHTDELVVLTWDRAFIYEPRGETDVPAVLEVAKAQSLEMRHCNALLAGEVQRMHARLARARRTPMPIRAKRSADLARRLHTLAGEVTEFTERIDRALHVTEDVYLARIYRAALDLLRVPTVSAAVDRKLALIRDTCAALYQESSASRTTHIELLIIILVLAAIVIALVRP
jgi:hypothetical protein